MWYNIDIRKMTNKINNFILGRRDTFICYFACNTMNATWRCERSDVIRSNKQ